MRPTAWHSSAGGKKPTRRRRSLTGSLSSVLLSVILCACHASNRAAPGIQLDRPLPSEFPTEVPVDVEDTTEDFTILESPNIPPGLRVCVQTGPLPDRTCTPGKADPRVTQATLSTTICATRADRGGLTWTEEMRPPVSVTNPIKRRVMAEYLRTDPPPAYEADHHIPIEIGGDPWAVRNAKGRWVATSLANAWPQPLAEARHKDNVENAARRAICDGSIPLDEARGHIAQDWVAFGRQLGVSIP